MFFRKKKTPKLVDIVPKVTHTDYVYNNIMGDLGHACDDINRSTPLMVMAYAYARRTAAAAMYIQGLYDRDTFAYVQSMFVNFQKHTDGSVEFQEAAAAESDDFMQTYSTQINGLLTKGLIMIARDYDVSGNQLDDADLFREVIDTIHRVHWRRPARAPPVTLWQNVCYIDRQSIQFSAFGRFRRKGQFLKIRGVCQYVR